MTQLPLKVPSLLRNQCLIGGEWIDADSRRTVAVRNPATGETIATVPQLGAAETTRAIDAAAAALPAWRARTADNRAQLMRSWFDLMMANQEDLAVLMTCEQGKPLSEARGEIVYAASFIEWFARKASESMARSSRRHGRTGGSSRFANRWESALPSRRGTSRQR